MYIKIQQKVWLLATAIGAVSMSGLAHSSEGGVSSNGGDIVVYRFETARQEAVDQLQSFDLNTLNHDIPENMQEFLKKRRDELLNDVRITKHEWAMGPDTDTQTTCALTQAEAGASVRLSLKQCKDSTIQDAAMLLVHESIHHLGILDEDFAYQTSRIVMETGLSSSEFHDFCDSFKGKWQAETTEGAEGPFVFGSKFEFVGNGCSRMGIRTHLRDLDNFGFEYLLNSRKTVRQQVSRDDSFDNLLLVYGRQKSLVLSIRHIDFDNSNKDPDDIDDTFVILERLDEDRIRMIGYTEEKIARPDSLAEMLTPSRVSVDLIYVRK